MPDPAVPRLEEADPMSRWNPDLADSWVGSPGDMADAVGIDPELVENAPPDIAETLAGAIAYPNLEPAYQQEVDGAIRRLRDKGHADLADQLEKLPEQLKNWRRTGRPVHLSSAQIETEIERLEGEIERRQLAQIALESASRPGRKEGRKPTILETMRGTSSEILERQIQERTLAIGHLQRESERRRR